MAITLGFVLFSYLSVRYQVVFCFADSVIEQLKLWRVQLERETEGLLTMFSKLYSLFP